MEASIDLTHHSTLNSTYSPSTTIPLQNDTGILHLIGRSVGGDKDLIQRIQDYTQYQIVHHEDRHDVRSVLATIEGYNTNTDTNYAVLPDFDREGVLYKELVKRKYRLIGAVVIYQCIHENFALSSLRLERNVKGIVNTALFGHTISFTNFQTKDELNDMSWKVRVLGGTVAKDFDPAISDTILIANSAGREKFKTASYIGINIVKQRWLEDCYLMRREHHLRPIGMLADDLTYVCPLFFNLKMTFLAYSEKEDQDFIKHCEEYGATKVYLDKNNLNTNDYVVVNVGITEEVWEPYSEVFRSMHHLKAGPQIVDDRWFWECIATNQFLDTGPYKVRFTREGELLLNTKDPKEQNTADRVKELVLNSSTLNRSSPFSGLGEKRKSDVQATHTPAKKKTSAEQLHAEIYGNISLSETHDTMKQEEIREAVDKRVFIIEEFRQTEKTYTEQLTKIEKDYYAVLEGMIGEKTSRPVKLSNTENKMMFRRICPILVAHKALGDALQTGEFSTVLLNWIGKKVQEGPKGRQIVDIPQEEMDKIFNFEVKKSEEPATLNRDPRKCSGEKVNHYDILKLYLSYLNSNQQIMEMIDQKKGECLRFKGLLKNRQTQDRLGIKDLMIAPIQRLPRIILLLDAIIKNTDKARHHDLDILLHVQKEIKRVTASVNDKKKTIDTHHDTMVILTNMSNKPKLHSVTGTFHNKVKQYYITLTSSAAREALAVTPQSPLTIFFFEFCEDKENIYYNDNPDSYFVLAECAQTPKQFGSLNSATAAGALKKTSYRHIESVPLRRVTHVMSTYDTDEVEIGITYRTRDAGDPVEEVDEKGQKIVILNERTISLRAYTEEGKEAREDFTGYIIKAANKSRDKYGLGPVADGEINESNLRKQVNNCLEKPPRVGTFKRLMRKFKQANQLAGPGRLAKAHSIANLAGSSSRGAKGEYNTYSTRLQRDSH